MSTATFGVSTSKASNRADHGDGGKVCMVGMCR
jgi:hypothetical protein